MVTNKKLRCMHCKRLIMTDKKIRINNKPYHIGCGWVKYKNMRNKK